MSVEQREKISRALRQTEPPIVKRCPRCGEVRDASEFSHRTGRPEILNSYCLECARAYSYERFIPRSELTPGDLAKRIASQRRTDLKKYGITPEDYDALLAQQGGSCAICRATEVGDNRTYFCVDHDHETNQVRGLLCNRCNRGIGMFGDSAKILLVAVEYLTAHHLTSTPERPPGP